MGNTAKKYDVLVAGELNVDLILNKIDGYPSMGKEVLADEMTVTLGSSSAIFASNLKTLGTSVAFIGKLGTDNFGDFILNALGCKGVDTTHIIRTPQYNTGATMVLNYREDRAMVTYPGAMAHFTVHDISDSLLQSARHLHVSSVFLQQGLKADVIKLFKKAKAFGLTTSVDPQWDPAEKWDIDLAALLPYIDIFMPNAAELKALTSNSSLTAALHAIKDKGYITVVKDGSNGAYLNCGGNLMYQPAYLNKTVADSIGAGDSFNAGFIHYFIHGKPKKDCLEFGALIGAVNTTHAGGTGAFSSLQQVKQIASTTFKFLF